MDALENLVDELSEALTAAQFASDDEDRAVHLRYLASTAEQIATAARSML